MEKYFLFNDIIKKNKITKFNPYHDELGRFSSKDGSTGSVNGMIGSATKGKPMSFEQANGLRANPNFYKSHAYRTNCQSCVVAYEARRRGYDVQALPKDDGDLSPQSQLARNCKLAWIDPKTGKRPKVIEDRSVISAKSFTNKLNDTIKDGERYELSVKWKGTGAHIVCADRVNGKVRIYDPQCSRTYVGNDSITAFAKNFKYFTNKKNGGRIYQGPRLMRVDNMEIDLDFAEKVLKQNKY